MSMSAAASARRRSSACASTASFAAADRRHRTPRAALASLGLDYRGERVRLSPTSATSTSTSRRRRVCRPSTRCARARRPRSSTTTSSLPWQLHHDHEDLFGVARGEVDVWPGVTALRRDRCARQSLGRRYGRCDPTSSTSTATPRRRRLQQHLLRIKMDERNRRARRGA